MDDKLRAGVRFAQIGMRELEAIGELVTQDDKDNPEVTTKKLT